jgi:predicted MFS family arabinose efflux permease
MLLTGLLLMAVGLLGAALAWNYGALLACRLLTGVGAALIPSNSLAMLADVFPLAERGKAIGWVLSATGVGAVVGVPVVACLLDAGGWHLPFSVLGTASLVLWILFWVWLPRYPLPSDQSLAFVSHYREVGANGTFWSVLAVGALQQMVFFGMFAYLAAHLMQTYHLPPRETALPLALAGGCHCRGLPGGVGRGPSPSISIVRPVVRGEWRAGGPGLHHTGIALGHRGTGLWRGKSRPHIDRCDAHLVAGTGG